MGSRKACQQPATEVYCGGPSQICLLVTQARPRIGAGHTVRLGPAFVLSWPDFTAINNF